MRIKAESFKVAWASQAAIGSSYDDVKEVYEGFVSPGLETIGRESRGVHSRIIVTEQSQVGEPAIIPKVS